MNMSVKHYAKYNKEGNIQTTYHMICLYDTVARLKLEIVDLWLSRSKDGVRGFDEKGREKTFCGDKNVLCLCYIMEIKYKSYIELF